MPGCESIAISSGTVSCVDNGYTWSVNGRECNCGHIFAREEHRLQPFPNDSRLDAGVLRRGVDVLRRDIERNRTLTESMTFRHHRISILEMPAKSIRVEERRGIAGLCQSHFEGLQCRRFGRQFCGFIFVM